LFVSHAGLEPDLAREVRSQEETITKEGRKEGRKERKKESKKERKKERKKEKKEKGKKEIESYMKGI
jgi:hypothetical protein